MTRIFRYSEGDESYILIDGRNIDTSRFQKRDMVRVLCSIYEVQGLAVLGQSGVADFAIRFYGSPHCEAEDAPDSVCRCLVAFANLLGIKSFHSSEYCFESRGAIRQASILSWMGESKVIRLSPDGEAGNTVCDGEIE